MSTPINSKTRAVEYLAASGAVPISVEERGRIGRGGPMSRRMRERGSRGDVSGGHCQKGGLPDSVLFLQEEAHQGVRNVAEIRIPKAQFMALSDEGKYQVAQLMADEFSKMAENAGSRMAEMTARLDEVLKKL